MTKEELWQSVLAQLQFKVSPANFATWFKNTKIIEKTDQEVFISVPNNFSKEWLSKKYHSSILKILQELDSTIKKIHYTIVHLEEEDVEASLAPQITRNSQSSFEQLRTNQNTGLNPRYTFEQYVTAPFNELAHAAAWAVSEDPGHAYNPLFIYGGVGLGKTHLLQAIGNNIKEKNKSSKIEYISTGKFVSRIVASIREKSIEKLKFELQNLDVLIVDDVQFLSGKEKTQEEFFHLFNALYQKNKQIVLSSDRLPSAIPTLEKRLQSRFEGGMIADISRPEYESRLAVLESKIQESGVCPDQDVLEYIAFNVQNNVRELEGAVNRLCAFQKLYGELPDLKKIKILLRDLVQSPTKTTTVKKIIESVSRFYSLDIKQIFSSSRRRDIAQPRQVAMYLLREELRKSYPSIGETFGGRDHTTAMYACQKISSAIEQDQRIAEEIHLIRERIYSG